MEGCRGNYAELATEWALGSAIDLAVVSIARVIAPFIIIFHCSEKPKTGRTQRLKYWEIIVNDLKKRGWHLGWVAMNRNDTKHRFG